MGNKTTLIENYLDEILPNVGCELVYHKDYEFLLAVMLSAQTTDKAVNKATEQLFNKYQSLEELASASPNDLYPYISQLGMYKVKANNIIGIAKGLIERFNKSVPDNKEDLMSLPGVGNKTAEVTIIELYHYPEFPVDTHVARISKRLGLAKEKDDVSDIERKLRKAFIKEHWIKLHHQFIHFGRVQCRAKNPLCENCKLIGICREKL
ncbi:MAG: endonuclease III [Erysipelotrichaceae bacterium]|nr:endonuclease III [Erysipelotrichaceae bacterium]